MKEAVSRKKEAHKAMCQCSTEEDKMHKSMKNKANKAASKAMKAKAEEALTELQNCPNGMHRPVKGLKTDFKEEEVMKSSVSMRRKEVKSGRIIRKRP